MKRHLLINLCLVLALTYSCKVNDQTYEQGNKISFAAQVEAPASKGEQLTNVAQIGDMGVFAYNTGAKKWEAVSATATSSYLHNAQVVQVSPGVWKYNPDAYWPLDAQATLFAYAPYPTEQNGISVEERYVGAPVIGYVSPAVVANQSDLLVGERQTDLSVGTAHFKMRHALTAITFSAKVAGLAGQQVKMKRATLHQVQQAGSLSLDLTPAATVAWAVPYTTEQVKDFTVSWDDILDPEGVLGGGWQSVTKEHQALFVVPQKMNPTAENPSLQPIGLSVVFEVDGVEQAPILIDLSAKVDWQAGKQVDYQITYVAKTNTVELAFAVTDWSQVTTPSDMGGVYLNMATTVWKGLAKSAPVRYYYSTNSTEPVVVSHSAVSGDQTKMTLTHNAAGKYIDARASKTGQYKISIQVGNITKSVLCDIVVPTHNGWAGSNIYWDGTKLTFDDYHVTTHEQYMGVYFQWGSLVALSPSGATDEAFTNSHILYAPGPNNQDGVAWSKATNTNFSTIPRPKKGINTFSLAEAGVHDLAKYQIGDIRKNAALNIGDICQFLSDKGWAPYVAGNLGWRMPTADELSAQGMGSGEVVPVGGFSLDIGHGNADGTTKIGSGGRSAWPFAGAFFPAAGGRFTNQGRVDLRGAALNYWSARFHSEPDQLATFMSMYRPSITGSQTKTGNTHSYEAKPVRCVRTRRDGIGDFSRIIGFDVDVSGWEDASGK